MKRTVVALLVAAFAGTFLYAAETGAINLEKVTCPVSGKAAKQEAAVAYKDHQVFMCCEGCPSAFEKNTAKYATKANMQLVQTKQFKQVACPISGRPAKEDVTAKVAEVEVGLCCMNCQGKVNEAEADDKLALVFADKAFEKGFKPAEADESK